jgi:hypothetical protein
LKAILIHSDHERPCCSRYTNLNGLWNVWMRIFVFFNNLKYINNNNYIYPGYPHHLRVFQWGPASKLQLFTILIVNI